jgi:hypothetical protein
MTRRPDANAGRLAIRGVLLMQDEPFRNVFQHRADSASIRHFIVDIIDQLINRTGVDADFPRMTDTKGTTSAHHYNRIQHTIIIV